MRDQTHNIGIHRSIQRNEKFENIQSNIQRLRFIMQKNAITKSLDPQFITITISSSGRNPDRVSGHP